MGRLRVLVSLFSVVAGLAGAAEDSLARQAMTPDEDRHFLWRAIGPTGTEVYLLGSIHALPEDAYPLAPEINSAYAEALKVFFEVDLQDTSDLGGRMMAVGKLPPDRTLGEMLDSETRSLLDVHLEGSDLSFSAFDSMKPWMAALSLTSIELMKAGFSADAGLDLHLARRAHKDGKSVEAFESADYQIGLFSGMNEEESLAFLRYSLKDMDTVVAQLGALTEAWKAGDVGALSAILTEAFADEPVLFDRMVTVRNRAWLPRIEALLSGDDTALVVVGALHLVGSGGLIELLQDQGYRIDQL